MSTFIFLTSKIHCFHLILLTCYSVVCSSHRNLSDSTLPKMASTLMSSLLGAFPHFFLVYYPPCIIIFWEPCTSSCFFWPMVLFTASSNAKFLSSSECSSAKDLGSELDVFSNNHDQNDQVHNFWNIFTEQVWKRMGKRAFRRLIWIIWSCLVLLSSNCWNSW